MKGNVRNTNKPAFLRRKNLRRFFTGSKEKRTAPPKSRDEDGYPSSRKFGDAVPCCSAYSLIALEMCWLIFTIVIAFDLLYYVSSIYVSRYTQAECLTNYISSSQIICNNFTKEFIAVR